MKDLPADMLTALASGNVSLFQAVEIDFMQAGVLRVANAVGEFVIDGDTYYGIGTLGDIEAIEKDGSSSPEGLVMTLSGISPTMLSDVMTEHYQGKEVTLLTCVLYGTTIHSDIVFRGRLNTMDVTIGEMAVIRVEVENRLVAWNRGSQSRWNDASHQRTLDAAQQPDKFFEFVEVTAGKEIQFDPYISQHGDD